MVCAIKRALGPGGLWVNCGPLQYHIASYKSVRLTWEEVLLLVASAGFTILEHRLSGHTTPHGYNTPHGSLAVITYTDVLDSMSAEVYREGFFAARLT